MSLLTADELTARLDAGHTCIPVAYEDRWTTYLHGRTFYRDAAGSLFADDGTPITLDEAVAWCNRQRAMMHGRSAGVITGDTDGTLNPVDGRRYLSNAAMERENLARGYLAVGNETKHLTETIPAQAESRREAEQRAGVKDAINAALAGHRI